MTTARLAIAARFKQDLAPAGAAKPWVVKAAPWVPAQVAKDQPAVAVWRASMERQGVGILHQLTINLYLPKASNDDAAETEAEDALDDLLTSLQRVKGASWSRAERQVFDQVISGWQITCQLASEDVYRQAVLAGG